MIYLCIDVTNIQWGLIDTIIMIRVYYSWRKTKQTTTLPSPQFRFGYHVWGPSPPKHPNIPSSHNTSLPKSPFRQNYITKFSMIAMDSTFPLCRNNVEFLLRKPIWDYVTYIATISYFSADLTTIHFPPIHMVVYSSGSMYLNYY